MSTTNAIELTNFTIKPRINVFLLAGQSNMVGVGHVKDIPEFLIKKETKVIVYADGQMGYPTYARKWVKLNPYLGSEFGPEFLFGLEMEKSFPGENFAFIKWSQGATDLAHQWNPDKENGLYSKLMNNVNSQMTVLSKDYDPVIVGMIWMQGESDALYQITSTPYKTNLINFIKRIRVDTNCPDLRIVIGRISNAEVWTYKEHVREAQTEFADEDPLINIIDTDDLSRWPNDVYHYDSQGQIDLGTRFASSMVDLVDKGKCFIRPKITSITGIPGDFSIASPTLIVNAHDNNSQITGYSFDNGLTWQTSNKKSFGKISSDIIIKVKNILNNQSSPAIISASSKPTPSLSISVSKGSSQADFKSSSFIDGSINFSNFPDRSMPSSISVSPDVAYDISSKFEFSTSLLKRSENSSDAVDNESKSSNNSIYYILIVIFVLTSILAGIFIFKNISKR